MDKDKKMINPMAITVAYVVIFGMIREGMLPMAHILRALAGVAMLFVLGHNLILSRKNEIYFQKHKISYIASFVIVLGCLVWSFKMDWAAWMAYFG